MRMIIEIIYFFFLSDVFPLQSKVQLTVDINDSFR